MIQPLPSDIFRQDQVLNNTYQIEGVVGRGGSGEVYCARNLVTGRAVAIKALSRQFSGNDDYVDLMRREEAMRDIAHDAVVRYSECSRSDDGHVFLVMDFIDGPSLQESMQRRMDPRDLLIVAHRVAEGLAAAHRRGIVHRDLSPDNIVLRDGEAPRATIIDFGIAKDTRAGARTVIGNDFGGKYEYAAPEQLEGQADARSDLYALGATLLAVWSGKVPFEGLTLGEIMRRKQAPLDTQGLPEPLKGLIDWLAAPSPAARPASADEALARIEAALKKPGRSGGSAGPAGSGATSRVGVVLVAAAVLPFLGVGGWWLWSRGDLDLLLGGSLPPASPYRLSACRAPAEPAPEAPCAGTSLSGHAPDAESAALLRDAFARATGMAPAEDVLSLASGVPSEGWAAGLADLMAGAESLRAWSLEAENDAIRLAGLAHDAVARDGVAAELARRAGAAGLTLDLDLKAPPDRLSAGEVEAALDQVATCGPLVLADAPEGGYGPGDTIRITGDVPSAAERDHVRQTVAAIAEDREVEVNGSLLNAHLCRIRALLPQVPTGGLSIRLMDGGTGEPNPTGVFHAGEIMVPEIEVPGNLAEGWLWVVLVDIAGVGDTGTVTNLVPRLNSPEHRVDRLGRVESGIRRIDLAEQIGASFRIADKDFGKSEFLAFLSREPLFGDMPGDLSVEGFAGALSAALAERPGNLVAVASRVFESRP